MSSEYETAGEVTWRPGSWSGVVAPSGLALLSPEVPQTVVAEIWHLMHAERPSLTLVLDRLIMGAGGRLSGIPDFALVLPGPSGVRIALRGEVGVEVDAQRLETGPVSTWFEVTRQEVGVVEMLRPGAEHEQEGAPEGSPRPVLPVVDAVLPASAITCRFGGAGAVQVPAGAQLAEDTEDAEDADDTASASPADERTDGADPDRALPGAGPSTWREEPGARDALALRHPVNAGAGETGIGVERRESEQAAGAAEAGARSTAPADSDDGREPDAPAWSAARDVSAPDPDADPDRLPDRDGTAEPWTPAVAPWSMAGDDASGADAHDGDQVRDAAVDGTVGTPDESPESDPLEAEEGRQEDRDRDSDQEQDGQHWASLAAPGAPREMAGPVDGDGVDAVRSSDGAGAQEPWAAGPGSEESDAAEQAEEAGPAPLPEPAAPVAPWRPQHAPPRDPEPEPRESEGSGEGAEELSDALGDHDGWTVATLPEDLAGELRALMAGQGAEEPRTAAGTAGALESPSLGEPAPEPAPEVSVRQALSAICPDGHANPTNYLECRCCGAPLLQSARMIPCPPLGRVRASTGEVIELDRPVLVGRAPQPQSVPFLAGQVPSIIVVEDNDRTISRNHLLVELDEWSVLAHSLSASNGTILRREGMSPMRLSATEPVLLCNGDVLDLGDGRTLVFEDLP